MEPHHLWIYFSILLLIAEIITPGFFISIFSVGALSASIFAYFGYDFKTQFMSFLFFNIIAFIYVRPLLLSLLYANHSDKKTNVDTYIGKTAVITEGIDNNKNVGRLKVTGESWVARSDKDEKISKGNNVIINHRKGTTFYVSKINQKET